MAIKTLESGVWSTVWRKFSTVWLIWGSPNQDLDSFLNYGALHWSSAWEHSSKFFRPWKLSVKKKNNSWSPWSRSKAQVIEKLAVPERTRSWASRGIWGSAEHGLKRAKTRDKSWVSSWSFRRREVVQPSPASPVPKERSVSSLEDCWRPIFIALLHSSPPWDLWCFTKAWKSSWLDCLHLVILLWTGLCLPLFCELNGLWAEKKWVGVQRHVVC